MPATVMTIGQCRISEVVEVVLRQSMSYFTKDQELLATNRYWLHPHFMDDAGGFDLVFRSWILEVGSRVVLIDPCNGNDRPHPVGAFNMLKVPYIERMQESGYRPQDIDFVVCTHLHHDHCGWNTQLRNGQWVPTFTRARYVIRREEYENLRDTDRSLPPTSLNLGVFERSVAPVMQAGQMELVTGNHRIIRGVTAEPAFGHTIGHQMVHLESGGRHAYFTGDAFHHPVQLLDPASPFGLDPSHSFAVRDDLPRVIAMRKHLLEISADLDAPLIAAHVQKPYGFRASRSGRVLHFTAGVDP